MQLLVAPVLCYVGLGPMAITQTEIRKVITRLDDVKIELLRLRAQLLPEEAPTPSVRRRIRESRREIERGHYVTLTQLRKELGV
jgi:ribosomal protein L29